MRVPQLLLVLVVSTVVSAFVCTGATAGTQNNAKLALHAGPKVNKTCGKNDPVTLHLPCSQFNTYAAASLPGNYIYLVVAQTDTAKGIAGLSCGVQYDFGSVTWSRCADLEFPSGGWPATNGSNRITWAAQSHCQKLYVGDGGMTVAGAFYIYSYVSGQGTFKITKNNNVVPSELQVADCDASESDITQGAAGTVAVGPVQPTRRGCNPCIKDCLGPIPVQSTTWGRIKSKHSRSE